MEMIVKQFSGLGNQLFQYAAGRYYSRQEHATLQLAVDLPHRAVSHGEFPRPFLLGHFALTAEAHILTSWDRLMLSGDPRIQSASSPLKKVLKIDVFTEPVSQRYRFLPSLPLRPEIRTLYIVGYWQAYRVVDGISSELRRELHLKAEATGKNLEILKQIRSTPHSVSLHVRRGDYALAAEGKIVLPETYYMEAISMMRGHVGDPTFFVFSDDVPFAREFLPEGIRKVFVDHNDDFSSHEDMRLMASCEHHIIANSTFSWWGAWLNPRTSKIVIAPRHWQLSKESYYPDLFPPEWLLLNTDSR
jgi:hypothetical protein